MTDASNLLEIRWILLHIFRMVRTGDTVTAPDKVAPKKVNILEAIRDRHGLVVIDCGPFGRNPYRFPKALPSTD
jgi:hypothetical protein